MRTRTPAHHRTTRHRRPRARLAASALLGAALVVTAGCSGGDDGAAPAGGEPELDAAALEGREVARAEGCTACHSTDGRDGLGPTWRGLHGSEVRLEDGSTVVADEEYLIRSIEEPNAQIREGFSGTMPERDLSPEELDAVLAYLEALSDERSAPAASRP